jgi:hypothetical protein
MVCLISNVLELYLLDFGKLASCSTLTYKKGPPTSPQAHSVYKFLRRGYIPGLQELAPVTIYHLEKHFTYDRIKCLDDQLRPVHIVLIAIVVLVYIKVEVSEPFRAPNVFKIGRVLEICHRSRMNRM